MPIDSRDKRASSLFLGLPFGRIYPLPDGSIIAADFEQENHLYSGIPSGGGPTGPGPIDIDFAQTIFFSDRPSRPRFVDGSDDPTEAVREGTRAAQGRPRRPREH